MFVPFKNPPKYRELIIYLILFDFGYGVTIIYYLENKKLYVSDMLE